MDRNTQDTEEETYEELDNTPDHPGATYEDLALIIERTARRIARDYPDIDWEDIRQELAVFVLVNGKSIKLHEYGGNPTWLLGKVAQTYCLKLRTQHHSLSAQYSYRPSDVKKILETAFLPSLRGETHVPEDAKNPLSTAFTIHDTQGAYRVQDKDPFAFPDAMDVASDVLAAFMGLNDAEKLSIFKRYAMNEIPDNSSWERQKLNAAVRKLTYRLNTYRGPGRRKARSNAGARMAISQGYEG